MGRTTRLDPCASNSDLDCELSADGEEAQYEWDEEEEAYLASLEADVDDYDDNLPIGEGEFEPFDVGVNNGVLPNSAAKPTSLVSSIEKRVLLVDAGRSMCSVEAGTPVGQNLAQVDDGAAGTGSVRDAVAVGAETAKGPRARRKAKQRAKKLTK